MVRHRRCGGEKIESKMASASELEHPLLSSSSFVEIQWSRSV